MSRINHTRCLDVRFATHHFGATVLSEFFGFLTLRPAKKIDPKKTSALLSWTVFFFIGLGSLVQEAQLSNSFAAMQSVEIPSSKDGVEMRIGTGVDRAGNSWVLSLWIHVFWTFHLAEYFSFVVKQFCSSCLAATKFWSRGGCWLFV